MTEKDISELIDNYLNGELERNELDQFKSRLFADPEFAEEVELQKAVNQIIFENKMLELKDKVGKDTEDHGPGFKLGRVIGSVIIIILLAFFYFSLKESDKAEKRKIEKEKSVIMTPNSDGQGR